MFLPVICGGAVHSNEGQELGKSWFFLPTIQVLHNNAAIKITGHICARKSFVTPLPENLISKG